MRVAVVENMVNTALGQVGVALREAGAEIVMYRPYRDGNLPRDLAAEDALVVLGGEQSAIDDAAHPYLPALARTMRIWAEADRAVLGICLGSQILARAFGAANLLGTAPEFGWREVRATAAGRADPLVAAAGDRFRTFQWHSDTFTLPEGAVHLAENGTVAHQAFRLGRAAYGTQFHFEADRTVVAAWTDQFGAAAERMQPGWGAAHAGEAARHGPLADAAGLALARAWVGLI
ncbi:MAG: type 1 glutamine amidotransferase [Rhodobacteraceae bacterium]|jgi:GMP synthase (glutamine-hydrolysing)|uniref:type 1 glutamine amidotransferase n=1 Tax=Albidovulum sp. TaxID=1872424 RepID=UPI001DF46DBF|nr:type 1 glutamine amidotransferase [uncultured Defluviimonas sp.]MCB2125306.1 type 1 glutamine amidotransferase [Paracoccaceae bacterium]MCC0070531.1 type 1 glutamine amidotransferase [Paracoccaceae bacterium]